MINLYSESPMNIHQAQTLLRTFTKQNTFNLVAMNAVFHPYIMIDRAAYSWLFYPAAFYALKPPPKMLQTSHL